MKYMNMKEKFLPLNLQFFSGEGGDGDGDDTGEGDDQDEDDSDEDGEEDEDKKEFSKKDMENAVKKRLAREKRKWQREQQKKQSNKDNKDDGDDKDESEDSKARKAAEDRASKAEVKVACYEAGVSKDSVDDVVALARSYMAADEDLDLEDAIEKVVKKYPQFKSGAADHGEDEDDKKGKSWGERQKGQGAKKLSGVEKRFYELNPDLKK